MKGKNLASGAAKLKGNAGKATLPNGEKLSDKIQQNKVNQGANGANKQKNNNANKKDSKNGKDKEKQEGKGKSGIGLPDVQSLGTEAAKEALKKAAGAIPYTKWIPKGIRDKIIDKFMDSDAGQAAVEKGFKQVRTSIIIGLVGIVASLVMLLLQLSAVATLIMSPLAWIKDLFTTVGNGLWSFGNFVLGNGWCTDNCGDDIRAHYYSMLDYYDKEYSKQCDGVNLNKELITATIFYDRMVSKKSEDVKNGQFEEGEDGLKKYYKYNPTDITELDSLYYVYKNEAYKTTCSTDVLADLETSFTKIKGLINGDLTISDIDNIIISSNRLPTVAELTEKFGDLGEGNTTLWNEFLVSVNKSLSCFENSWERFKSIFGAGEVPCIFNRDNYKSYLTKYYIPIHYAYLTGEEYKMTYDEIADEILKLGDELLIKKSFESAVYCESIALEKSDGTVESMDLEDYVARVVTAENSWSENNNIENMKAQAIVSRTLALKYTDNCSKAITNSVQNVADTASDLAVKATEETKNLVLFDEDKLTNVTFDDLAIKSSDSENYYLKQNNVAINKSWLDARVTSSEYDAYASNHKGTGFSIWGSRYLQSTGNNYEQILNKFYTMAEISQMGGLLSGGNYYSNIPPAAGIDELNERSESYKGNLNVYSKSAGNTSQCPWYAKSRAIEIVYGSNMDEETKNLAIESLRKTGGNGTDWYKNPDGTIFSKSTDYTQAVPGSIVSWSSGGQGCHTYGHVAIVEQVFDNGTVLISESWNKGGADGSPNTWANVAYQTKIVKLDYIKYHKNSAGCGYTFNGYVYLLG